MTAIYEHHAQLDSPAIAPDASDSPLRVLVVDDHPAVRMGLRELFEDQPDFVVVAAVDSADAAMALAEREPIDVAVVDYQLGSRNGLWLSRKLKRLPQPPRVVIYSAYCDGPLAATSVVAEADGLVSKGGVGARPVRGRARGGARAGAAAHGPACARERAAPAAGRGGAGDLRDAAGGNPGRGDLGDAEHLVGGLGVAAVDDASQARGASRASRSPGAVPGPTTAGAADRPSDRVLH